MRFGSHVDGGIASEECMGFKCHSQVSLKDKRE